MQSILISSKDKTRGREEAEKILKDLKINKFDIAVLEFEKAVGIADVREIQRKIYLSPLKGDFKGVLLDATPGITLEAQNALLKTLEEPPESTLIIVQVLNSDEILPTILSRCKVIELSSKKEYSDISKFIAILNSKDEVGERLKLAQDLSKDKEQSLEFLENLILSLRKKLLAGHYDDIYHYSGKIKLAQKFHTVIKTTNVNLRLALENLFLNL